MNIFHVLYSLVGSIILGGVILLLIRQTIVPSVFDDLKEEFGKVMDGRVSYSTFVSMFLASNGAPQQNDNQENAKFKRLLPRILEDESFLRQALSNPKISYFQFVRLWMRHDLNPSDGNAAQALRLSFSMDDKSARRILDKMVEGGFCAPDNYTWTYNGSGKSRLMGLFADAIHLQSGGTIKFEDLNKLWGIKNVSDLKRSALESTNIEHYLLIVRTVFPDYDPVAPS